MFSVAIITKNEEVNLERCLRSVSWADEIIIVDSGSTDATLSIAKKFNAKIYQTDWPGYGLQKQRAFSYCKNDWILSIDADEELSPKLINEIKNCLVDPQYEAFSIPRPLVFKGKVLRHCTGQLRQLRLFKKSKAYITSAKIHERIHVKGSVGRLKGDLYHYSFKDIDDILHRINTYSSLGSELGKSKNKSGGLVKALSHSLWTFLKIFIFQGGFRDGVLGFIFAFSFLEGTYYRYLKMGYGSD